MSGSPSDTLKGSGAVRSRHSGNAWPGCIARAKTRTTSRRRGSRSGTTTPIRSAALFQARARPVRRRGELVARGRERNPDLLRGLPFGPAFENRGPEEIPRLRRQDVETERDELLRPRGRKFQIGQPRRIGEAVRRAAPAVLARPAGEGLRVLVAREIRRLGKCGALDAPCVRDAPGGGAIGGSVGHREQLGALEHGFPEPVLLRGRQELGQVPGAIGVDGIFIEALHERAVRKDVRVLPYRQIPVRPERNRIRP